MTFHFTPEELSFVADALGYKRLEGFGFVPFDRAACEASLLKKEYIFPYKGEYELTTPVRVLMSAWGTTQYTLVRMDYLSGAHVFAIHASSKYIFTFSFHEGQIELYLCDFSAEVMDRVLADYLAVEPIDGPCSPFNISFTGIEFDAYFVKNADNDLISRKTGLPTAEIALIKETLSGQGILSFMLQNVEDHVGCLGILKKHPQGYVLVKHIVPDDHPERQKVVVAKGNMADVIDSVYVL